jgi:hypothetical protein
MLQIHNHHATLDDKRDLLRAFAASREPTVLSLTRSREVAKNLDSHICGNDGMIPLDGGVG